MRKIYIVIVFVTGLMLASCSGGGGGGGPHSLPTPTCEEGGIEVTDQYTDSLP